MRAIDRRRLFSVDRAVGRYARSLRHGTVPCRADGNAQDQAENYRCARQRLEMRAEQVRQILLAKGVPPMQFVAYRNFGLHLDRLVRENSGLTLRNRAAEAVNYWIACGLDPEILGRICADIFGLALGGRI